MVNDGRRRAAAVALGMAVVFAVAACQRSRSGTYQGYVEGEFVHVASGVAGRLDKLFVTRGQVVEARAPLFHLESVQEAAAVRQAEQTLEAAGAQLADLGTGRRAAEIEVVKAQLDQAMAALKQSASQRERDQAQFDAGGISRNQLETSRAKHDVDAARVRELERQLEVARLAARPDQVKAQASQVAAAHAARDQTKWRLDEKQVAAAQAAVVVDTLYREGEWVPAGAPVVRLLPPTNLKIRFFVPEPEMPLFTLGRALEIHCLGCGGAAPATVTFISPEPEFTPPVIYSDNTKAKLVFMVEARPTPESARLMRPGLPVEVAVK